MAGLGTSLIATVTAIGTEIESALNARGPKETETENEIRGTPNALRLRDRGIELVHSLSHNVLPLCVHLDLPCL